MELCIFIVISLIPSITLLLKIMEVDNMEIIKTLIIEIFIQILFGGVSEPLAVEFG